MEKFRRDLAFYRSAPVGLVKAAARISGPVVFFLPTGTRFHAQAAAPESRPGAIRR